MKKIICFVICLLLVISFDFAFAKGGSSGGGSSGGGRSGGFSSSGSGKISSGGSSKVSTGSSKVSTGHSSGVTSKSSGSISPKTGRETSMKITTTKPAPSEMKNYIAHTPKGQTVVHYYEARPASYYHDGGMPTWFWIWFFTSNNQNHHYRHDENTNTLYKDTVNKETGQVEKSELADPEEFEDERNSAWISLVLLSMGALIVAVGMGFGIYYLMTRYPKWK